MKGEKQIDTLSVNVGPMRLRNPTMLASGILGISQDIFERLYDNNIGAIVTKSISVDPMKGYANPTIVPLGNKTYLNAVGLSNPGVYAFSHEIMRNKFVPILVSLVGSSEKDFPKMISFLDSLNVIGYEINLSCPHVSKMGMEIGDDPEMVSLIIRTIKRHTRKPISVKIGIGSMDVVEIARVAVESGADMITAINTVRAMKIDVQSMIPVLSNRDRWFIGKGHQTHRNQMRIRNFKSIECTRDRMWWCIILGRCSRVYDCWGFSSSNWKHTRQ